MSNRFAVDIPVRFTDNPCMTPSELKAHCGGTQSKAAAFLGVRQGLISEWDARGSIPVAWQIAIERKTDGVLKADLEAAFADIGRRRGVPV